MLINSKSMSKTLEIQKLVLKILNAFHPSWGILPKESKLKCGILWKVSQVCVNVNVFDLSIFPVWKWEKNKEDIFIKKMTNTTAEFSLRRI